MAKEQILVVDDEALMREYVEEALVRAEYRVDSVASGSEGIAAVKRETYDVVVTDLKMKPDDGIAVLNAVREANPDTHVIIMTAYGTVESAVDALKNGATDYILKPFSPEELEMTVERALERKRLERENRYLRDVVNETYDFESMIGDSAVMQDLYDQVRRVADSRSTILIRGESGTGKELVARAVHHAGNRRDRPFIKVNCAALSAGLLESELFGHEKGSFTGAHDRKIGRFELADGGTLLLDEISEISPELQPKLLRALQEREFERVGGTQSIQVDTRIICTSNRNLEESVENGQFREDLFFRLNVIPLRLPSLRERREDIPALMDYFLERFAQENAREIDGYTHDAREAFHQYDWPGNVRELQNAVERAVVLHMSGFLDGADFNLDGKRTSASMSGGVAVPVGTTVSNMEKELILRTLEHCGQNRTHAAKMMGISVRTLRNKLKEYAG